LPNLKKYALRAAIASFLQSWCVHIVVQTKTEVGEAVWLLILLVKKQHLTACDFKSVFPWYTNVIESFKCESITSHFGISGHCYY